MHNRTKSIDFRIGTYHRNIKTHQNEIIDMKLLGIEIIDSVSIFYSIDLSVMG